MVILFALLPLVIHEFGHYGAASLCGRRLHFVFSWGRLGPVKIPRWTWQWPEASLGHIKIICQAGFVAEIGLAFFMPWPYRLMTFLHFVLYPHYAGDANDFKGMI